MSSDGSDIIPVPERVVRKNGSLKKTPAQQFNYSEYLSWRRLHLSKSKLSNVTEMASYMAGFAVVGTVELQINDQDVSPPLLTAFGITTALLVGVCMIAITISTCVLPHMEAVARTSKTSSPDLSPHNRMTRLVDISWILTNSIALFLFTVDMILMGWIKYTFFSRAASIAGTLILAPVLVIIVIFGILFYRMILKHQYVISRLKYEELEEIQVQLERTASLECISPHGYLPSLSYSGAFNFRSHSSKGRSSRNQYMGHNSSRSTSRTGSHGEKSFQLNHNVSRSSPNVNINPSADHLQTQKPRLSHSLSEKSLSPSVLTV